MTASSFFIRRKAAASLLHSARTAEAISRPLNTFVTVNLWQLGLTAADASRFFQDVRERHFQRWSSYTPRGGATSRNGPPTYVWVIEAPNTLAHVHWMLHIERGRERAFAHMLHRVLSRRTRTPTTGGSVMIEPVTNAEGLKLYFAKGIDPYLGRLWLIRPVDCGAVAGRRSGTSRNLGPAEWRPRKIAYQYRSRAA